MIPVHPLSAHRFGQPRRHNPLRGIVRTRPGTRQRDKLLGQSSQSPGRKRKLAAEQHTSLAAQAEI